MRRYSVVSRYHLAAKTNHVLVKKTEAWQVEHEMLCPCSCLFSGKASNTYHFVKAGRLQTCGMCNLTFDQYCTLSSGYPQAKHLPISMGHKTSRYILSVLVMSNFYQSYLLLKLMFRFRVCNWGFATIWSFFAGALPHAANCGFLLGAETENWQSPELWYQIPEQSSPARN